MTRRAVLLLAPMALGGCVLLVVAAVAGAVALGTYKYANNELHRDYQAAYDAAWEATKKAARDLGFHAISENKDFQRGVLEASRADDTPVKVVVEKQDEKNVHLSVRVGTFESDDNRSAAQAIHEKIFANLGGKP